MAEDDGFHPAPQRGQSERLGVGVVVVDEVVDVISELFDRGEGVRRTGTSPAGSRTRSPPG